MKLCAIHKIVDERTPASAVLVIPGDLYVGPGLLLPVCAQCASKFRHWPEFRQKLMPLLVDTQKREGIRLDTMLPPLMEAHGIPWPTDPKDFQKTLDALIAAEVVQ